ncbi:CoA pyrophosphatase [Uliginosibacterium gangwonense]|uniref:CoA pyrophosphatase n=1 Tax=Uliginosibacterium gangwonense TaxID=392736 RepID=UPI00037D653F|nr:CoA pyrophosphatase [Uliginosibacterium gangwonense]
MFPRNANEMRRLCQHADAFSRHCPAQSVPDTVIASAVLILLQAHEDGLHVLLTRRTEHLRHHAGQISFPGGRREEQDATAVRTALREAQEEVGVVPSDVEVLGCLPDFLVPSGFLITPVLGLLQRPAKLVLDDFEVAEAFEVPLAHLMQRIRYQQHRLQWQGSVRHVHAVAYQGRFVWGATAGILVMLADFLSFAYQAKV